LPCTGALLPIAPAQGDVPGALQGDAQARLDQWLRIDALALGLSRAAFLALLALLIWSALARLRRR